MGPHLPFIVAVGIMLHARLTPGKIAVPQAAFNLALASWAGLYATEVLVSFLSFLSGTAASVLGVLLSTAAGAGLLAAVALVARTTAGLSVNGSPGSP